VFRNEGLEPDLPAPLPSLTNLQSTERKTYKRHTSKMKLHPSILIFLGLTHCTNDESFEFGHELKKDFNDA
jgi:hypothetical protein